MTRCQSAAPVLKICKTCGWFDGDEFNPSRLGICSDPAIVRASPVGKSTEVVKGNRKACVNWKPREGNT